MELKFNIHLIFKLQIILIVSLIFTRCDKNCEMCNQNGIKLGCIPDSMVLIESMFGGFQKAFFYTNNSLGRISSLEYIYDDCLLRKIKNDNGIYETYEYDNFEKIVKSKVYNRDSGKDILADIYTYTYNNENKIIKAFNLIDSSSYVYTYQLNSNNIDTLLFMDKKGKSVYRQIFKYDDKFNFYKNIHYVPINLAQLIYEISDNNIIFSSYEDFRFNFYSAIEYSIKYNSNQFPIEILKKSLTNGISGKMMIKYKDCD